MIRTHVVSLRVGFLWEGFGGTPGQVYREDPSPTVSRTSIESMLVLFGSSWRSGPDLGESFDIFVFPHKRRITSSQLPHEINRIKEQASSQAQKNHLVFQNIEQMSRTQSLLEHYDVKLAKLNNQYREQQASRGDVKKMTNLSEKIRRNEHKRDTVKAEMERLNREISGDVGEITRNRHRVANVLLADITEMYADSFSGLQQCMDLLREQGALLRLKAANEGDAGGSGIPGLGGSGGGDSSGGRAAAEGRGGWRDGGTWVGGGEQGGVGGGGVGGEQNGRDHHPPSMDRGGDRPGDLFAENVQPDIPEERSPSGRSKQYEQADFGGFDEHPIHRGPSSGMQSPGAPLGGRQNYSPYAGGGVQSPGPPAPAPHQFPPQQGQPVGHLHPGGGMQPGGFQQPTFVAEGSRKKDADDWGGF